MKTDSEHSAPKCKQKKIEESKFIVMNPKPLTMRVRNNISLSFENKDGIPVDVSQIKVLHIKPVHLFVIEPGLKDNHMNTAHTSLQYRLKKVNMSCL